MQNKLEWYELMSRRGALGKEDSFDYGLTVNADKGESELLQIFVGSFNQAFWWRRNLWLARQVECDLLIVTHAKIYVLNAKYYNGDFTYRESMAYFNGKPLQNDPLVTFQQSLGRLRKLLVDLGVNAVVEGRVVFMNPNYNVAIDDSAGVECVARYGVLRMFNEIVTDSSHIGSRGGLLIDSIGNQLLTIESESKYNLPVVNELHMRRMKTGISCPKCGRCGVRVSQRTVSCICKQFQISKKDAVIHAIEEYGKLFHHRPTFSSADIFEFIGHQIRRKYLSKILNDNYSLALKGPHTSFVNPHYRNPENFETFRR